MLLLLILSPFLSRSDDDADAVRFDPRNGDECSPFSKAKWCGWEEENEKPRKNCSEKRTKRKTYYTPWNGCSGSI